MLADLFKGVIDDMKAFFNEKGPSRLGDGELASCFRRRSKRFK
jgi:hypothetical protein